MSRYFCYSIVWDSHSFCWHLVELLLIITVLNCISTVIVIRPNFPMNEIILMNPFVSLCWHFHLHVAYILTRGQCSLNGHTGTNNFLIAINRIKTLSFTLWPQSTLFIFSIHWIVLSNSYCTQTASSNTFAIT